MHYILNLYDYILLVLKQHNKKTFIREYLEDGSIIKVSMMK